MSETSKRSTVYFDPQLHAALRLKAAQTHRSLSGIANDAVRAALAEYLRPIQNKDVARILQRMKELKENPRPVDSKKLSGQECYRNLQGVCRIIYEVADERPVVTFVKVGHRKHFYKRS